MKVALLYPRWTGAYGWLVGYFARRGAIIPPLNLALLGAIAEQDGHQVTIIDGEAEALSIAQIVRRVQKLDPDVIGLTSFTPFFHINIALAEAIRAAKLRAFVCVGGPHVRIMEGKALLPCFDFLFTGEAEKSWRDFLHQLSIGGDVTQIKGLCFWERGKVKSTGNPDPMTDPEGKGFPLDQFPCPALHLLPMRRYKTGTLHGMLPMTSIQSMRGCPWRCLVAGTQILKADGTYAKIESIRKGDRVVCADLKKGIPAVGTVSQTGSRIAEDIYRLTFSTGAEIDITGDHPVWTKAGWRRVQNLQSEYQILGLPDLRNGEGDLGGATYLRRSGLRQREDSTREVGREQPGEERKRSQTDQRDIEGASWPRVINFHARKECDREDVARVAEVSHADSRMSYSTPAPWWDKAGSGIQGCQEGYGSLQCELKSYDREQPNESSRGGCTAGGDNESIASSRTVGSPASEGHEQERKAFGFHSSPRKVAGALCGLQEVLDRPRAFREETEPGFYPYNNKVEARDPLQRTILAQPSQYERTETRLHGTRVVSSELLGRGTEEEELAGFAGAVTGVPLEWVSIESIAFVGRGVVYALSVDQYKNFFANNLLVHNCIFCCSDKLDTTRIAKRSPASIVAQIKDTVERFGVTHFFFVDDVLTLYDDHIREIADGIKREGLKITFEGGTRANMLDDDLARTLADAGLVRLTFGLETVDEGMRKTMQKKVPLEYYARANAVCNKYGIEALNSVMIGLPGETRATIKKTLDWLRDARDVKQANFAIAVPYPGTKFHEMAISGQHGITLLEQDFSKYRRYGSAVTKVGELSSEDLVEIQNEGFVSIYSAPWRWGPMFARRGVFSGVLTLVRVAMLLLAKMRKGARGSLLKRERVL